MKRFVILLLALSMLLCGFAQAEEIDLSALDCTYLRYNNFDQFIVFMDYEEYYALYEALPEGGILDLTTLDPAVAQVTAAQITKAAKAVVTDAAQAVEGLSADNIASVGFTFNSWTGSPYVDTLFIGMTDGTHVVYTNMYMSSESTLKIGPEEELSELIEGCAELKDGQIVPAFPGECYAEIPAELLADSMAAALPGPTYDVPEDFTYDHDGMRLLLNSAFTLNGLTVESDTGYTLAYDDKDHYVFVWEMGSMVGEETIINIFSANYSGYNNFTYFTPEDNGNTLTVQKLYDRIMNDVASYVDIEDIEAYRASMAEE